jgi:hypothetical protein
VGPPRARRNSSTLLPISVDRGSRTNLNRLIRATRPPAG